ncbi:eukaryotic translation initiation factor 5B-like [Bradysia coprophila]|uniref:eukaryotic translation initiation factor 5B-like n=1 Tax=Bradysia coprophila TaxID=38358 RepID=UPI00187D78DF|nr:eukaryotic translation initiation factor 5B-like [Bradysia coprophila]
MLSNNAAGLLESRETHSTKYLAFFFTEPGLTHDTRPWVYDFAIVVVDILLGLQLQTIESIRVFERMQTPFIVVLNKLDKLSNWQITSEKDVQDALENQTEATRMEFVKLVRTLVRNFRIVERDACLHYNALSPDSCINLVPTSAKTSEGMENLLHLLLKSCQRSSVAQRLRNREALLTNVYRKDFIDGVGSSDDCVPYNPKIQKVKDVHSIN